MATGPLWSLAPGLLLEYRAAVGDLRRAVERCGDGRWSEPLWEVRPSDPWMSPRPGSDAPVRPVEEMQVFAAFWNVAYHCIFYLDFYLSQLDGRPYRAPEGFGGPEEQDVDEHHVAVLPHRSYGREELLGYLDRGARKAEEVLGAVTEEQARTACPPTSAHAGKPFGELLQINLAHVREHGRQLAAAGAEHHRGPR